ncbi:MAG: hypothetical protein PHI53_00970 [Candidatus Pacebacteria bacterium]|nr:hypothetical protein [Candidatus Paceibacterota bacterium]
MKKRIANISSVGIIFRAANPAEIFIEVKDDTHPIKLVRRQLCPIGGNWIGDNAKNDRDTFDTFKREVEEEISFDRPIRDSVELNLLGASEANAFVPAPASDIKAQPEDSETLSQIKKVIFSSAAAFGDFLNTVTRAALYAADPDNEREGFTTLASYWMVSLREDIWKDLRRLQKRFKNLSNESITLFTSLGQIICNNIKVAFAHDRVLQRFFLAHGLRGADNMPLVPGLKSEGVGMPLQSYQEYLKRYEVAKKPI